MVNHKKSKEKPPTLTTRVTRIEEALDKILLKVSTPHHQQHTPILLESEQNYDVDSLTSSRQSSSPYLPTAFSLPEAPREQHQLHHHRIAAWMCDPQPLPKLPPLKPNHSHHRCVVASAPRRNQTRLLQQQPIRNFEALPPFPDHHHQPGMTFHTVDLNSHQTLRRHRVRDEDEDNLGHEDNVYYQQAPHERGRRPILPLHSHHAQLDIPSRAFTYQAQGTPTRPYGPIHKVKEHQTNRHGRDSHQHNGPATTNGAPYDLDPYIDSPPMSLRGNRRQPLWLAPDPPDPSDSSSSPSPPRRNNHNAEDLFRSSPSTIASATSTHVTSSSKPPPTKVGPITCYECKEIGHVRSDCPKHKRVGLTQDEENLTHPEEDGTEIDGFLTYADSALVETLVAKTRVWEEDRCVSFVYDGVPLLAMLDEYAMLRHEREEEKRRMRASDQKKFTEQLSTEQEFSARPSPSRPLGPKKVAAPRANGGGANGTPNRRLSLNTNQSTGNGFKSTAKEGKRDNTRPVAPVNYVSISKEDAASFVSGTDPMPSTP
ncbi:hypothetical protein IFM89_020527 [Coptis chinensis]|uniref:CCHC-type domain-containing protein n=1 Tax=Coptis chinensis TaxID=261450 RepID=A0A835H0A7_9MAGN|nr:hypothetical protein IFM89_020527 [Coptis chinensis]